MPDFATEVLQDGSEGTGPATQQWLAENAQAYDSLEQSLTNGAAEYNELVEAVKSTFSDINTYAPSSVNDALVVAQATSDAEYDYYDDQIDILNEHIEKYEQLCKDTGENSGSCKSLAQLQEIKNKLENIHTDAEAYLELEAGLLNAANADSQNLPDEEVEDVDYDDFEEMAALRGKLGDKGKEAKEAARAMREARRTEFKEHCYMLAFADKFAAKKQFSRDVMQIAAESAVLVDPVTLHLSSKSYPSPTKNASIMVEGDSFAFMNKLTANPNHAAFFDIPGSDLAHLQPMIKLYKVRETNAGLSSSEIEFGSNFNSWSDDLEKIMGGARNVGVGIKSFDFTYTATNPFATKKSIKGQLVLFANSFEELIRVRQNKRGHEYRFTDLALKTASSAFVEGKKLEQNPEGDEGSASDGTIKALERLSKISFRLRAVVGWARPPGNTELSSPEIKQALYDGHVTLNLTPTTHQFNIDEQGRVTMTINYLAYIDDAFDAHAFSVFNDHEVKFREAYRNLQIRSVECTDEKNKLKQFYKPQIEEDKAKQLKWLLNTMKKKKKIFYTSLPKAVANQFADGDFESVRSMAQQNLAWDVSLSVGGVRGLGGGPKEIFSFFYISDLIDVILEGISEHFDELQYSIDFSDQNPPKGADTSITPSATLKRAYLNNLARYREEFKKLRILLGPMHFVSKTSESETTINTTLGDVALPVRFFTSWLTSKLESRNETNFPLAPFVSTLLNELVRDYLNNDKCFDFSIKQKVSMQQAAVTGYGSSGNDPITDRMNGEVVLNIDSIPNTDAPLLRVSGRKGEPESDPDFENEYNYMIYFIGNMLPSNELTGDKAKDEERGIFHYLLGKDRGIIKGINLSKTDLTGLKEVRFEQEGYDGLQQLREVYDASITCYANVHAYPGTYIYIDPRGWAPQTPEESLTQLGLGGYYMITTADNSFAAGQAHTKIVARWKASKDGERNTMLGGGIVSKCRSQQQSPDTSPQQEEPRVEDAPRQ